MFRNIIQGDHNIRPAAANNAMRKAAPEIEAYKDAIAYYGPGSEEAQRAYWDALNAVNEAAENRNR